MTDISTQSYSWGVRSGLWLASTHGKESNDSITFDSTTALEAEHYPNGFLRDGTPVGEVTASPGVYRVWDKGASDGTETIKGFVYDCPVISENGAVKTYVGCALLVHGFVILPQLVNGFTNTGVNNDLEAVTAADLPALIGTRNHNADV